ncbi:hypothetical protein GCM10027445_12820 [Amycolatopsis endophytica]|uniref:Uncharacterized protein n=1 Tax=Amycolatopsis endophytica TaxID=860233 RepID=A0A853B320_9PSEU|nr:hypothetical protein [Amycolatopsis endophytica]NYI89419.1 hypothetical protein [Amycolatopsis endophytica]
MERAQNGAGPQDGDSVPGAVFRPTPGSPLARLNDAPDHWCVDVEVPRR